MSKVLCSNIQRLVATIFIISAIPELVFACPLKGRFVDFNCDKRHKVAIVGDSIVAGTGDQINNGVGGYVKRLAARYPKSQFFNLGFPGIKSHQLFAKIKSNLAMPSHQSQMRRMLESADIIILDVGRNDYWLPRPSASWTVNNIRRIRNLIRSRVKEINGITPIVAVSSLLPTVRTYQKPFISAVNQLLYNPSLSGVEVEIAQDQMPQSGLGRDGLHPNSIGYDQMLKIAARYIRGRSQELSLEQRPDRDADGIYDFFEKLKYQTNPRRADTDGDGFSDGHEIFVSRTDPLDASLHPLVEEPIYPEEPVESTV